MFKVGDAVRVRTGIKSGEGNYLSYGSECRFDSRMDAYIGVKMLVTDSFDDRVECDGRWYWLLRWIEPWNDAEEWDGSKWVPKKKEEAKPCVVSGPYGYMKMKSTNEAFRYAEEWAKKYPGTEYVVYQEKGSRKVEKQEKSPTACIVTVGYGKDLKLVSVHRDEIGARIAADNYSQDVQIWKIKS